MNFIDRIVNKGLNIFLEKSLTNKEIIFFHILMKTIDFDMK